MGLSSVGGGRVGIGPGVVMVPGASRCCHTSPSCSDALSLPCLPADVPPDSPLRVHLPRDHGEAVLPQHLHGRGVAGPHALHTPRAPLQGGGAVSSRLAQGLVWSTWKGNGSENQRPSSVQVQPQLLFLPSEGIPDLRAQLVWVSC